MQHTNTYRVSTLEMWGWRMIVDRDETFDFVVGIRPIRLSTSASSRRPRRPRA